jgi:hypothetical protein
VSLNLRRLWNFYALTGTPDAPEVCRVPVTAELQRELSDEYEAQLATFGLDQAEHVEYEPGYRPEEGELFVLRDFALPTTFPDLSSAPDVPRLSDAHIEAGNVRALIGVPQSKSRSALLCFQGIDNRQLLKRDRVALFMSAETFTREKRSGLVIRNALTAVYREGNLYFPAEPPVRRFLDLSQIFAAATEPQVRAFFEQPIFAADQIDILIHLADTWTRRKISSIDQRGIVGSVTPAAVVRVGKDYGVQVRTRTVQGKKALQVPQTKAELKDLLRLLDQDFLSSSLTTDRFRVNSKKRVDPR